MLTIRNAQMTVFVNGSRRELEARLATHVTRHFPQSAQPQAPDALQARVAQALDRALEHGFSARDDVFSFVSLAFALGPHFDRDPALPWVTPHLRSGQRPEVRMANLCAAAIDYLKTLPAA